MALSFYEAKELSGKVKCSIHKTGRLGFSEEAADLLKLDERKFAKIGTDPEEDNKENLFLLFATESDNETFKIYKAGKYYFLKTQYLFNDLGVDFRNNKIKYGIQEFEHDGIKLFKLFRREKERNK